MKNLKLIATYDAAFDPLVLAERIQGVRSSEFQKQLSSFKRKHPNFDLCFLMDSHRNYIQYVQSNDSNREPINLYPGHLISSSIDFLELTKIIEKKQFVVLLERDKVNWLISWQDLNKAPFVDWVFSHISLLEKLLKSRFEEIFTHPLDALEFLSEGRKKKALDLFNELKSNGAELNVIQCLQLCDVGKIAIKKELLTNLSERPASKSEQNKFVKDLENLRNRIAHVTPIIQSRGEISIQLKTIIKIRHLILNV